MGIENYTMRTMGVLHLGLQVHFLVALTTRNLNLV